MKNPPNINAGNLELPPGHRWVDIANEPFTREALFITGCGLRSANGPTYVERMSYCIPVNTSPAQQIDAIMKRIRSGPEPKPDFTGHADRLDRLVDPLAGLAHAFRIVGNDGVADRLAQLVADLLAEVAVARGFTKPEAGQ